MNKTAAIFGGVEAVGQRLLEVRPGSPIARLDFSAVAKLPPHAPFFSTMADSTRSEHR